MKWHAALARNAGATVPRESLDRLRGQSGQLGLTPGRRVRIV